MIKSVFQIWKLSLLLSFTYNLKNKENPLNTDLKSLTVLQYDVFNLFALWQRFIQPGVPVKRYSIN